MNFVVLDGGAKPSGRSLAEQDATITWLYRPERIRQDFRTAPSHIALTSFLRSAQTLLESELFGVNDWKNRQEGHNVYICVAHPEVYSQPELFKTVLGAPLPVTAARRIEVFTARGRDSGFDNRFPAFFRASGWPRSGQVKMGRPRRYTTSAAHLRRYAGVLFSAFDESNDTGARLKLLEPFLRWAGMHVRRKGTDSLTCEYGGVQAELSYGSPSRTPVVTGTFLGHITTQGAYPIPRQVEAMREGLLLVSERQLARMPPAAGLWGLLFAQFRGLPSNSIAELLKPVVNYMFEEKVTTLSGAAITKLLSEIPRPWAESQFPAWEKKFRATSAEWPEAFIMNFGGRRKIVVFCGYVGIYLEYVLPPDQDEPSTPA
ncbi:hypothetical protein [Caenispirillum bisanense]|uniref:hypothetical protein n=1 Tax=Caenispirillum bisanense TaxID=414052 RepID=UPI001144699F|nr:hypothetical protein [Caenispirillum bisanense]